MNYVSNVVLRTQSGVSGWQIAATLATAAAALVALGVVILNLRQRDQDRRLLEKVEGNRALAQARLVGVTITAPTADNYDGNDVDEPVTVYELSFGNFTNLSDRPVLSVMAEAWMAGQEMSEKPWARVEHPVVVPGEKGRQHLDMRPLLPEKPVSAWRIRWTDADGRQWVRDQAETHPRPFHGEPPTRYPAP